MLPQARPQSAESSWLDVVQEHVRASSLRILGASDKTALLDELRAARTLAPLLSSRYPDSDVLRVPAEVAVDVEPTRFVTSASSAGVGVFHRWMSAAWVEKRFWRALRGVADGARLTVLPLRLSALGRSLCAVVATDNNALLATLARIANIDGNVDARAARAPNDSGCARVLAVDGVARDDRFVCTSVDDMVLWSSGWYSGPAQVIEESLGVGFPALECLKTPGTWAAPATIARFEERGKPAATIAFVGGAHDDRLAASWARGAGRRGSAKLLADGPQWFARTDIGLVTAPPVEGCRLPLRMLRAPSAASVLAQLHRSLLFTNAATTDAGLPWWDERGDAAPGELIDWGGMTMHASATHRATHADASVIVPYALLRDPEELAQTRARGDLLDAVVFVVEVHAAEALLLEARSWQEGVALAVAFDALGSDRMHDPLALRSFPGDPTSGLRAWLDLSTERGDAPRVFVWTVPRHFKEANRLAPSEVISLVADAVHGHPAVAKSPLGALRASSKSHVEPRAVVDALGKAADELGSRCPPALRRIQHTLLGALDA